LGIGFRGDSLAERCYSFDLHIANHEDGPNAWTFCSSLGVEKRLDYIIHILDFAPLVFFAGALKYHWHMAADRNMKGRVYFNNRDCKNRFAPVPTLSLKNVLRQKNWI
jgi:hypothetical protein